MTRRVVPPSESGQTSTPTAAAASALKRPCVYGAAPVVLGTQCVDCQRASPFGVQAKLEVGRSDDPLENEADRAADQVMRTTSPPQFAASLGTAPGAPVQGWSADGRPTGTAPPVVLPGMNNSGRPLDRDTRSFMETRFGHDFGAVRVHTEGAAAAAAKTLHARAFTAGQHLVFNQGRYQPQNSDGRKLIAHELAHTIQQRGGIPLVQRDDDEEAKKKLAAERQRAKKRLETWAAAKDPAPSTDPTNKDFAFTAQELSREITHKPEPDSTDLLDKPTDKAKLASWRIAFRDAYQLALMILDTQGTEQRESRAAMIATDLATAGFISEAMDVAGKLPNDNKEHVFEAVAKSPGNVSADQFRTLSTFFASRNASPNDHPLLNQLTDRSGAFAKKLGTTKLLAALKPTLNRYRNEADYREDVAEILVFDASSRMAISDWLWTADKDFLFEILNTDYFGEPGYDVDQFQGADGKPRELTMAADMPWVYTYKQKFYTDYLVKLGAKHKIDIKAPVNLRFAALKAWLESETEDIGKALAAEHPNAPDKVTEAYQHIADIFFFHVDRGDVKPNLAGKLGHLGPDAPRNMRLKADCDVLATYATRLLKSAGFTPVGYMAVEPDAGDSHAVALLSKPLPAKEPAEGEAPQPGADRYYIVNNKQVTQNDAVDKEAAIKATRDDALGVYDPEPNAYRVYYEDAGTDGAMTRDLWTTEESVRRKDLGKDPPPPPATP